MKVLNFEDSVYKANAIRKILGNRCGVASVEQVSNVEDGLKMLKDAENAGEPFDLIITDMHFPMRSGAISDTEAGEKLVQILQERGIDVLYTRTTDIYESPYQKAMEANEAGVDFFISIHRNSFPQDNAVSGVESLVYDKSGIKLEMAENINEQLEGIGFVNLGVKARPGLVVLRRTKMPAVLVEVGFINSDTDNMLFDDNFSDIALAIAEGILDTLGINTPVVPLPDENEAPVAPLPDENTYPDDAFPNEDNVPVVPLPPRYTVQTGAFRNPLYAERLRRELSELDFPASVVEGNGLYRVMVGVFPTLHDAAETERRLRSAGYQTVIVSQ